MTSICSARLSCWVGVLFVPLCTAACGLPAPIAAADGPPRDATARTGDRTQDSLDDDLPLADRTGSDTELRPDPPASPPADEIRLDARPGPCPLLDRSEVVLPVTEHTELYSTEPELPGDDLSDLEVSDDPERRNVLLRFDVSQVAGCSIETAALGLVLTNDTSERLDAHVVREPWARGATWTGTFSVEGCDGPPCIDAEPAGTMAQRVTGAVAFAIEAAPVQAWTQGVANHGLLLRIAGETDSNLELTSREGQAAAAARLLVIAGP